MSGSSFMSLPKPWNIGIKADHLSWDVLFHCSRQDMFNVYPQIIYIQRFQHVIGNIIKLKYNILLSPHLLGKISLFVHKYFSAGLFNSDR